MACETLSYKDCTNSGNRFATMSACRETCGTAGVAGGESGAVSGSGSNAGLVAAEVVIGVAAVALAVAAVVLGVRYAQTAGVCLCHGSYTRFFDFGGIGILRRNRAGSTSSRGALFAPRQCHFFRGAAAFERMQGDTCGLETVSLSSK